MSKKDNIMRIDFEEFGIKKTALYNGNVTSEEFARNVAEGYLYSNEVVIMDRKQFETVFADLIPNSAQINAKNTNADNIRNMDVDKLADILMCPYNRLDAGPECDNKNCHDCCVEWLNKEIEE